MIMTTDPKLQPAACKRFFALVLATLLCLLPIMAEQNPYIHKVYEYVPAPGQFIGENYPAYSAGETEADVLARVNSTLSGSAGANGQDLSGLICLGAWGGYITFGFDHAVVNAENAADLIIYGNAFYTGKSDDGLLTYGSPEPGIIYVSQDDNHDGQPNDTWYEIAGSETERTLRQYAVTYHYSDADILWTDNQGNTGTIRRNAFHLQDSYYPAWRTDTEYTLTGSLLPTNYVEVTKGGIVSKRSVMFDYGYADCWPNDSTNAKIDIDWAIDAEGNPVKLSHIDFVKVQTGIMLDIQPSGELSTEISGAADLHPELVYHEPEVGLEYIHPYTSLSCKHAEVFDVSGRILLSAHSVFGVSAQTLCAGLPEGVYVVVIDDAKVCKYIKR